MELFFDQSKGAGGAPAESLFYSHLVALSEQKYKEVTANLNLGCFSTIAFFPLQSGLNLVSGVFNSWFLTAISSVSSFSFSLMMLECSGVFRTLFCRC